MEGFEFRHDRDLEIIGCPDCGAPAEIVWRTELPSTDGQIEHLDVRCVRRHKFFMPAEGLIAS